MRQRVHAVTVQPSESRRPRGGAGGVSRRGAQKLDRHPSAALSGSGLSDESAPSAAARPEHSFFERVLDRVERAGNKMPHPAILFLAFCGVVIVLSQVLYWFDVKATYEVVPTPPVAAEQIYYGGSTEPAYIGPTTPIPARDYDKVVTETTEVQGLLTGPGVGYLFTSFVSNFGNFAALAIILVVMIGVGLAEA